jgi:hypothetical protein
VLFLFEDAHWIDSTSLDLLDRIAERVRRLPVLMVVTFRPEFESTGPAGAGDLHDVEPSRAAGNRDWSGAWHNGRCPPRSRPDRERKTASTLHRGADEDAAGGQPGWEERNPSRSIANAGGSISLHDR